MILMEDSMEIISEEIPIMTLDEFADKYGLVMSVMERNTPIDDPNRYVAGFKNCEIKKGAILSCSSGWGRTQEDAIRDYAKNIELKLLVVNAMSKERKEIRVPRLKPYILEFHDIHIRRVQR